MQRRPVVIDSSCHCPSGYCMYVLSFPLLTASVYAPSVWVGDFNTDGKVSLLYFPMTADRQNSSVVRLLLAINMILMLPHQCFAFSDRACQSSYSEAVHSAVHQMILLKPGFRYLIPSFAFLHFCSLGKTVAYFISPIDADLTAPVMIASRHLIAARYMIASRYMIAA